MRDKKEEERLLEELSVAEMNLELAEDDVRIHKFLYEQAVQACRDYENQNGLTDRLDD